MILFPHLLAEAIAILDLGREGAKLLQKIDLQQIGHRVKTDKQLVFGNFFGVLDKEVTNSEGVNDLVETNIGRKGDK
jgi:hypothetical protein